MFGKKHHKVAKKHAAKVKAEDAFAPVRQDNVAVPEVRTGKVDVSGDFEREQHNDSEQHVVFDTLAVPEVHTGKCHPVDKTRMKKKHHKHGLLHILAEGGPED